MTTAKREKGSHMKPARKKLDEVEKMLVDIPTAYISSQGLSVFRRRIKSFGRRVVRDWQKHEKELSDVKGYFDMIEEAQKRLLDFEEKWGFKP